MKEKLAYCKQSTGQPGALEMLEQDNEGGIEKHADKVEYLKNEYIKKGENNKVASVQQKTDKKKTIERCRERRKGGVILIVIIWGGADKKIGKPVLCCIHEIHSLIMY